MPAARAGDNGPATMAPKLEGTFTALVTPFTAAAGPDGEPAIDWAAYDRLLDDQVAAGIAGVVPCGTTGESPALSGKEQEELVARAVKRVAGKCLVVAGTGSNSTRHAVELSRAAEAAGASAVMVVVPYYNKPTQDGLVRHYLTVARSVAVPVVVYNIPGRSGVDLLPEALGRIVDEAPNVVAVKEATGNVLRAQELVRRFGTRLSVLSGDDALTLPMVAVGARGVISVTSNLLPAEVVRSTRLALDGNVSEARKAHLALLPVHEAMFLEANPGPVKAALHADGKMTNVMRGPLAPMSGANVERVLKVVSEYRAGRA